MKKYIIKNNISILEALKKIKANKNKTLLVVNIKNQLIGSVSNAEIRKTILNKNYNKKYRNLSLIIKLIVNF